MPQVGDRVVYLQQGHKLYYDRLRDKRRGPWDTIVSTAVCSEHYALKYHAAQKHVYAMKALHGDLQSPDC